MLPLSLSALLAANRQRFFLGAHAGGGGWWQQWQLTCSLEQWRHRLGHPP